MVRLSVHPKPQELRSLVFDPRAGLAVYGRSHQDLANWTDTVAQQNELAGFLHWASSQDAEKLEAEERSPEDTAGADTEAEVVRRQAKLGALGGDVLAEMRYCSFEFEFEIERFLNFLSI